jgi:hypothetical protein
MEHLGFNKLHLIQNSQLLTIGFNRKLKTWHDCVFHCFNDYDIIVKHITSCKQVREILLHYNEIPKEFHKKVQSNTNKNDFSITYSKKPFIFRWALGLFQQSQAVVHTK